jgi:hypothetical protein
VAAAIRAAAAGSCFKRVRWACCASDPFSFKLLQEDVAATVALAAVAAG